MRHASNKGLFHLRIFACLIVLVVSSGGSGTFVHASVDSTKFHYELNEKSATSSLRSSGELSLTVCHRYAAHTVEGPASHLCLVFTVCRSNEKKSNFAGPPLQYAICTRGDIHQNLTLSTVNSFCAYT